jgi:restriction system protein
MWIRRKIKRLYHNLVKVAVFLSALVVAITLVNQNSSIQDELPFILEIKNFWQPTVSSILFTFTWFKEWGLLILLVVILGLALIKLIPYYLKVRRVKRSDIRTVDQMTGDQFEDFLVVFFRLLGYSARKTKKSRDHGADLVLDVNGVRVVVQAKRERNKVSNSAIQEVVASKAMYNADEAWVVTNSYFTQPAIELARANNVQLWDRNRLIKELSRINMKKQKNNTA